MGHPTTVVGLFGSESDADQVVSTLRKAGYADSDISILGPGRTRIADDTSPSGPGDANGVAWGAGIGGAAGLLATAGVLAIPGFGPILALGPLAATLTAATGGGLIGALVDWGVPEATGRKYEQQVRQGNYLLLVRTTDDASAATATLQQHGARDVYTNAIEPVGVDGRTVDTGGPHAPNGP